MLIFSFKNLIYFLLNDQFFKFYGGGGLVAKSCPTLVIPWTIAHQVPLSMGFPRQKPWSGLLFAFPGDLPDPGIKLACPEMQANFKIL